MTQTTRETDHALLLASLTKPCKWCEGRGAWTQDGCSGGAPTSRPCGHCDGTDDLGPLVKDWQADRVAYEKLERRAYPLFDAVVAQAKAIKARHLTMERCRTDHAVTLVRAWHSRLPNTQDGPWQWAFRAHYCGQTYAVALWNNPSARTLPAEWLELRRMACAPDAPRNTASRFLGWMLRYFREHIGTGHCISYQDTEVHSGTIYRAAGWEVEHVSHARARDRAPLRAGTKRLYRSNLNGAVPDSAPKVRWGKEF